MNALRDSHVAAGLFLCHAPCQRVIAHFGRLTRETAGLVEWSLVADHGHLNDPSSDETLPHPSLVMPRRFAAAQQEKRLTDGAGMMDIVIMPWVLAATHEHVWAMEFDVDYSGNWSEFFKHFVRHRADLLTTTLLPRHLAPNWPLWSTARKPVDLPDRQCYRSFAPLMRLSRRFAAAYVTTMELVDWGGHCEFTIPTIAHRQGFRVSDINGAFPRFIKRHYRNTPSDDTLSPGTFVWRPARLDYFHENPASYAQANRLYHPVKAKIASAT